MNQLLPPVPGPRHRWSTRLRRLKRPTEALLLIGITVLAFGLRLYCLDCSGLWQDEQSILSGILNVDLGAALRTSTPLYSALVWLTSRMANPVETSFYLRLPSAIAGAMTPVVVYALGRQLFGRREALTAALLTALSTVLLDHSQEMRTYAVLPLLVAATAYCLVRVDTTYSPRWWLAAVAAMTALVFWSNTGVTVVAPTLAPYVVYLAWKLWRRRGLNLWFLAVAGLLLAAASIAALTVLAARFVTYDTPRPDISRIALTDYVFSLFRQMVTSTQFGLGQTDLMLMVGYLILALFGIYDGIRRGRPRGVVLCLLAIVIPAVLLAIFGQVQDLPPRFALFTIIFYFLLLARGLVGLLAVLGSSTRSLGLSRLKRSVASVVTALVLAPFGIGAFMFHTTIGHSRLAYRPDYRRVAQFLADHEQPEDVIVYVANPRDIFVSDFYLGPAARVPAYSVLDARLPAVQPRATTYWVIGYEGDQPPDLSGLKQFQPAAFFERVAIFREHDPSTDMTTKVERLGQALEAQPLGTSELKLLAQSMTGIAFQAKGRVSEAVSAYHRVEMRSNYRGESTAALRSATNDWNDGAPQVAWTAAAMARFYQPDSPAVYDWASKMLAAIGDSEQSRLAAAVRDYLNAH